MTLRAQPMSYQSELVHFLTGHASAWVMSQSKNSPCTRADWPRISFALNSACPWRSAARSPGRVLPSTRGFTNSAVVPRGIRRRRQRRNELLTLHSTAIGYELGLGYATFPGPFLRQDWIPKMIMAVAVLFV